MVGVKSAETINIMDTDAIFQSGGTCGFVASLTLTCSMVSFVAFSVPPMTKAITLIKSNIIEYWIIQFSCIVVNPILCNIVR